MFKFNFDLDDLLDDPELNTIHNEPPSVQLDASDNRDSFADATCKELFLQDLVDALPSVISCSPLVIPLADGTKSVTLTRRDLFDARFQLIAEGNAGSVPDADDDDERKKAIESTLTVGEEHRHVSALRFIEAPSDLVPHVYEGGLKTWECAMDLVDYLDSNNSLEGFRGQDIIELGCGTAIPSLYILHQLFSSSNTSSLPETTVYLQDYNDSVLELVTFPNVLLTWYLSPASLSYRTSQSSSPDSDSLPFPNPPEPFELPITPSLKSAFLSSLNPETYNISLRFFSGSWSSFSTLLPSLHPTNFNLVLTSETIYRMDSLPILIQTLRLASSPKSTTTSDSTTQGECIVAAKVLYFGVGGGVSEFIDYMAKNDIGKVRVVKERKMGVGRVIMSLEFH
ncbi:hypothetical protein Agabi119p4_9487 [Agaricus bisporus var. burnettii]|uniref:protein-histidine N-methyltransferase n=1 Tax=Agaricus bisporus var. burnettii TaxID=192524 RepID=A0A8H7C3Q8_AGABI|nr:hypothetical protein Agabi119p4_9487 [Agaricus bisporus var. burnettii]